MHLASFSLQHSPITADLSAHPCGLVEALRLTHELRISCLLAHKADQIARDVKMVVLVRRGLRQAGTAPLALVEDNCEDDPFSEMAATVVDAAAQMESRSIGTRTKAALSVKRAWGEKTSGSIPMVSRTPPIAST